MKLIALGRGKIVRAVARHGLIGSLVHIATWPRRRLYHLSPEVRKGMQFAARQSARFDNEFGVDTDGDVELASLTIVGGNRDHGEFYRPNDPMVLKEALSALPIAYENFAFIDYGSGKGRALLVASEFPFKFIVGIEFAAELHRACEANLKHYSSPSRRCADIRPVHVDAAAFDQPDEPLVLYFFNPFDSVIFDAVLSRLHNALQRNPRPVWIIYDTPMCRDRLDDTSFLELVTARVNYRVYRSTLVDAPA